MKIENFKILIRRLDKELDFREEDIVMMSRKLPMLYNEYLDFYSKERRILNRLSLDKYKLHGELYKYYKHDDQYKWDTKGEIETQIHSNDKYYDMCVIHNEQDSIVNQLEKALTNISNTSFQIKNMIEYKKFIEIGI